METESSVYVNQLKELHAQLTRLLMGVSELVDEIEDSDPEKQPIEMGTWFSDLAEMESLTFVESPTYASDYADISAVEARPYRVIAIPLPVEDFEDQYAEAGVTVDNGNLVKVAPPSTLPDPWQELVSSAPDVYQPITRLEPYAVEHNLIIKDSDGTYRWEEDPNAEKHVWDALQDSYGCELYDLNSLAAKAGHNFKFDPLVRALYRTMGVSVYMYWETFYWSVNNPGWNRYDERRHILR